MEFEKVEVIIKKAKDLGLFSNENFKKNNQVIFDKFGNYVFSTDVESDYENKPVTLIDYFAVNNLNK